MAGPTIDPTVPQNTENEGLGASRIRNLAGWVNALFGQSSTAAFSYPNQVFNLDSAGLPQVLANPTTALGVVPKQYVDATSTPTATITNGGSGNAFTGTLSPAITSYVTGSLYRLTWTQASQGGDTIALNNLAALTAKKNQGGSLVSLAPSDIAAGTDTFAMFDGTYLQIIGIVGATPICTITNGGSGPAFTGTLVPGITSYVTLAQYRVKWTQASQGNDTIAFNGLSGPLTVKKNLGGSLVNLASGDVPAGATTDLIFDGTNLQLVMGPAPSITNTLLVYGRLVGNPAVDVVSSTGETTIYTTPVPGNTLGIEGILRITVLGDVYNNTGVSHTIDFKLYFGGTVVLDTTGSGVTLAANANRRTVRAVMELANLGAANSQYISGQVAVGSGDTNGDWGVAGATNEYDGEYVGLTVDTTSAQTLKFTVTLSASSVNLEFRAYAVLVEQVQA